MGAKGTDEKQEVVATGDNTPAMFINPLAMLDFNEMGIDDKEMWELSGISEVSDSFRVQYAKLIAKVSTEYELGDLILPNGNVVKLGKEKQTLKKANILAVHKVRAMFPEKFSPDNSFICRSLDGLKGAADGEYAGRDCSRCEYSKYPSDGGASPCRDQRLLLCRSQDDQLFHLLVTGKSVREMNRKFFSSDVQTYRFKAESQGQPFALMALNISVSAVLEEDKNYNTIYPILQFVVDKEEPYIPSDRATENIGMLRAYIKNKQFHLEQTYNREDINEQSYAETDQQQQGQNNGMF